MKKIYSIFALAIITFAFAMADDNIKVLRVFKGENVTTIPLAYVDSIDHSKYDADSVLWDTYKTSVLWAQDSIYQIPLEELDSIVIDDVSVQRLTAEMDNIKDHLATLDNQPLDMFQTNLMSWFNNECDYVEKATLSPSGEHIIVQLKDGIDIYVSFVNTDKIVSDEENDTNNTRMMEESREEQRYFDVSTIPGEEIINPNILYIQGRSMPSKKDEDSYSTAVTELTALKNILDSSPIKNGSIKTISKSLSFIEEDFSKYGLIIISQTHGSSSLTGNFHVEDNSQFQWLNKCNISDVVPLITVYMNQGICKFADEQNVFWVSAKYMRSKFRNNPVYGAYCHSSYLGNGRTNATIYGYETSIWYWYGKDFHTPATDSLIVRCNRFFNGYPYNDAVWLNPYHVKGDVQIPMISVNGDCKKPEVSDDIQFPIKHRYFSISTDPIIKRNEEGNPIITGRINGYNNLKPELKPVVFVHEGTDDFSPSDDSVIKISNVEKINDDGSFNFELKYDFESAVVYGIIAGFEYNGKTYYGETKFFGKLGDFDIKKTYEWGYMGNVLYSFEVTTDIKYKENQKDYKLVLYQDETPVLAWPIDVKKGEEHQITTIEFGCSKSDYHLDYDNYIAEVEDLYLTVACTLEKNGGPESTIVFKDYCDMVPFKVTYDQKPDVRIIDVKTEFTKHDVEPGIYWYYCLDLDIEAELQGSLWIDYALFRMKSAESNYIFISGKKHGIEELINDGETLKQHVWLYEEGAIIGYYGIVVNNKEISGTNHLDLNLTNDLETTTIEIVEGAVQPGWMSRQRSDKQTAKHDNVRYKVNLHDGMDNDGENNLKEKINNIPMLSKEKCGTREKLIYNSTWNQ